MPMVKGGTELLQDPVAQELLASRIPARLAYTWTDGSPRVVPIWFHWTGDQFVLGSPPKAPKLKALAADPGVALTIDDNAWPYKVMLVRRHSRVELLDDVGPEYELAATRYRYGHNSRWHDGNPFVRRIVIMLVSFNADFGVTQELAFALDRLRPERGAHRALRGAQA